MNISEINLLFQVSKPKQPMEEIIIKSWDQYEKDYKESIDDPASFWSNVADKLEWKKPYDKVLEWEFETPTIKWFEGGKINMAENCQIGRASCRERGEKEGGEVTGRVKRGT